MNINYVRIIFLLICISAMGCVWPAFAQNTDDDSGNSHAMILIYMVGSDLESGSDHSEGGMGTADLMDIIKGYGDTAPNDVNIIVAYGGSTAPGWEGMTIASINTLKQDAADGIIGNEGFYEFHDSSIDMGSKEGLETFLTSAQEKYSGTHNYLILWNHGVGFRGFGVDEISENMLSLSDITGSLALSETKFDIIGFDACLMAGFEVARAISPYAQYLIASQEISSGGWSYADWVSALVSDPGQEPEDIGRTIIDTFIDKEDPLGNTASMIDLGQLTAITQALDEVGIVLSDSLPTIDSVMPIARAYEKTTRFGENVDDTQNELMIDLGTLIGHLSDAVPQARPAAKKVSDALNDAIVYERHDDLVGNATGLSIADPLTLSAENYDDLTDILTISSGWDDFVGKIRLDMAEEIPPPELVSVGTNTFQIMEPTGAEEVSVVYFSVTTDDGDLIHLGTLPVDPDESGIYSLPDWDGEWYYLQDSSDSEKYALVDLQYGDTTGTGISKFISQVDIVRNGNEYSTIMYSYVDPESDWTRYSLRAYESDGNKVIFTRTGFTPVPGDILRTNALTYNEKGEESGKVLLGELALSGDMNFASGLLPDGLYGWTLMSSMPYGKDIPGEVRLLAIHDGVVEYIGEVS